MKHDVALDPTSLSQAHRIAVQLTDALEMFRRTLTRLRCAGAVRLFGREIVTWEVKLYEGS